MTILEKIKFEEEWLSEVNLTKENIKIAFAGIRATALEQQPCEDCISREALDNAISGLTYWHFENDRLVTGGGGSKTETVYKVDDVWRLTHVLPSVTPKFTDEEIQKMQELEQAQLDKAYELGMQTSFEDWLSTFNTDSATECFTAVQELKKRLEVNMKDIKRELSKEEYEKGKINPYYLISDDIKMGYGAYGAEVHEEDGKYYLTFSMGDSCD